MAYINQETKAKIAPKVKAILKKYGLSGTLSIKDHMKLVLTLKSGPDYFGGDIWRQLNHYSFEQNYSGEALKALLELKSAMNDGNWNNSDSQSDYFDVGWYVGFNVGGNKPYIVEK